MGEVDTNIGSENFGNVDFSEGIGSQLNHARNDLDALIINAEVKGTHQIKNKKLDYKLLTFFILPPSKEELFERLSNRDMKDKLIVEERMKQFERDVLHWINYDYVVINDDLKKCFSKINNLIDTYLYISKDVDPEIIKYLNFI